MSKSGSYNGGSTVKNTMNSKKARFLNKRALSRSKHLSSIKKRNETILNEFDPEVKLIKKEDMQ